MTTRAMLSQTELLESSRPTLHNEAEIENFRKRFHLHPDQIRRMRYGLYQMHEPIEQAFSRLGPDPSNELVRRFDTAPLRVVHRLDSNLDGSTKLVFQAKDGRQFETVLLRAKTKRTSVCVSTQVGCAAGCPFCATARMGLQRNLSTDEVLEQVLLAGRIARESNRRVRNVVFMGMGEPLDNETVLHESISKLLDLQWFGFPGHRLVVSTVGVPDAMRRLADRFPELQFAISLHSARPELRAKLIPHSRHHSWMELRDALQYVNDCQAKCPQARPIMIEHLLLDGVNDGDEDADALIEYVRGLNVHMNLIPFNPFPKGPNWKPTPNHDETASQGVCEPRDISRRFAIRWGQTSKPLAVNSFSNKHVIVQ